MIKKALAISAGAFLAGAAVFSHLFTSVPIAPQATLRWAYPTRDSNIVFNVRASVARSVPYVFARFDEASVTNSPDDTNAWKFLGWETNDVETYDPQVSTWPVIATVTDLFYSVTTTGSFRFFAVTASNIATGKESAL